MTMHDGYMVGSNWAQPGYRPELQEWAICKCDHMTESMEHILTTCTHSGQDTIWGLAKTIWEKKGHIWSKPTLGDILTCGMQKTRSNKDQSDQGESRFYRILISESARLIWLLRNERVINKEADAARAEVNARWLACLNPCDWISI